MNSSIQTTATGERADLLAALAKARYFLRFTVRDPCDSRASRRMTPTSTPIGNTPIRVRPCGRRTSSWYSADEPSTSTTAERKHAISRAVWKPTTSYSSRARISSP